MVIFAAGRQAPLTCLRKAQLANLGIRNSLRDDTRQHNRSSMDQLGQ